MPTESYCCCFRYIRLFDWLNLIMINIVSSIIIIIIILTSKVREFKTFPILGEEVICCDSKNLSKTMRNKVKNLNNLNRQRVLRKMLLWWWSNSIIISAAKILWISNKFLVSNFCGKALILDIYRPSIPTEIIRKP